jgi:hypothetical protein
MDQGVHEFRLLVIAGAPGDVASRVAGLADWLNAPPWAVAHLPFGTESAAETSIDPAASDWLLLAPAGVRLTALKRSADARALILRLHETRGVETPAIVAVARPRVRIEILFQPYEIKTLRLERNGRWQEVDLVSEAGPGRPAGGGETGGGGRPVAKIRPSDI